jgi:ppGpp synthetase/RelA/SpoT-type nucleotidyltranferase
MDIGTYEKSGHQEYSALARAVSEILTAAISANGALRMQQVTHRAKSPDSLAKKLQKRGLLEHANIESEIKDLAGCRVVFYTNADVNRFMNSGIVQDNFEVDRDKTKIHRPAAESTDAATLFISNNYVVRLKEQRASLPEYSRFRGMACEIQVQTTLNHAWSEMAHDTIYKKPELKGFGNSLMQGIEERMKIIMRDFLLPAGYEFQKVANDFERLSSGRKLFDQDPLNALANCKDNNERYGVLQQFNAHVLPYYDDIRGVHSSVRNAVVAAVKKARGTPSVPIATPYGAIGGHSAEQVAMLALAVLDELRYVDEAAIEATFDAICDLFLGASSDAERKRLLQSVRKLSENNLGVWDAAGPLVQQLLVARMKTLSSESISLLRPLLLEALRQVLRPEAEGTSSDYKSVTLKTRPVSTSEELKRVRSTAIGILKDIFRSSLTDTERNEAKRALSTAMAAPHRGGYSNDLLVLILDNSTNIVTFYGEVSAALSYELLQAIEHDLLWIYRHNHGGPPGTATDPSIVAAREHLADRIHTFRKQINGDETYVIYKTLVGFESVFPPAWDDPSFDYEKADGFRKDRIAELLREVTDATAEKWFTILIRCAQTESDDLATFPSFAQFLKDLAQSKPQIVVGYLDRLDSRLAAFLPAMLNGLECGLPPDILRAKVLNWIDEKRYIRQVVRYQRFAQKFDLDVFVRALNTAIEIGDDIAVSDAVSTASESHNKVQGGLLAIAFVPALTYLIGKSDTRWPRWIWPSAITSPLFKDLKPEHADLILTSLVPAAQIDHKIEEVLAVIGNTWPEKVVDYFGARLRFESSLEDAKGYDEVPYELDELRDSLAKIPQYLVDKVRVWYDEDEDLFTYRGGRLLAIVFPELSAELESAMRALIKAGNRKDLVFVIRVLWNYKGQPFTHGLLRSVVEALPAGDPILDDVETALEQTGTVGGEFGFVEVYKRKKREIEPWLSDSRERVRAFAERYTRSLDRQIAAEQRRAEQQLEMRKLDWGVADSGKDKDSGAG